jgi:hypothetical protein
VVKTQALKNFCKSKFRAITDEVERTLLVKILAKTQLDLIYTQLIVADPGRWQSVSIIR